MLDQPDVVSLVSSVYATGVVTKLQILEVDVIVEGVLDLAVVGPYVS